MGGDRDIKSWDQRLNDQVLRRWENYWRYRIDLTTARVSELFNFPGEFLYVEKSSKATASATLRLNVNTNDEIDLKAGVVIKTVFKDFFITNTAQAGEWIDLIVGINFEYYQLAQEGGGGGAVTGDTKTGYGAQGQGITLSLASLANNAKRESTAIDNSSDKFLDALVQLTIKTGAGAPANEKAVFVYAYGTVDGGTTYSGNASGSDAAFAGTLENCRLIGKVYCPAASTVYESEPMSVANAFGGILPDHWGIIVENKVGGALDAMEANHKKQYQGIYATSG